MKEQTLEDLLEYNRQGIVPGPQETREAFYARARYCLALKNHLEQRMDNPLASGTNENPTLLQPALNTLKALYDISPRWLPLFFHNYHLPFWHGGCAWIFQMTETEPTAAFIQLNRHFRDSTRYLGIYNRDELLAHEMVHVGRMAFAEPHFEELFAYKTAKSRFRRWSGPIVQSSVESVLFVLLMGILIIFDIFLVTTGNSEAYTLALWLKALPLGLIGLALIRLWKRHRTLDACIQHLKELTGSENLALAIAYRLTDKEIADFSLMTPQQIQEHAVSQSSIELRWELITTAYLNRRR